MSIYGIEEYKMPALRMQQTIYFYIIALSMMNAILGYLPLLEYGTAAANRSWNEERVISFATLPPIMKIIVIARFYFVTSMRLLMM